MKKIFLALVLIGLTSCATEKVLTDKECRHVCTNEVKTFIEIDNHACMCKTGITPRDLSK